MLDADVRRRRRRGDRKKKVLGKIRDFLNDVVTEDVGSRRR